MSFLLFFHRLFTVQHCLQVSYTTPAGGTETTTTLRGTLAKGAAPALLRVRRMLWA